MVDDIIESEDRVEGTISFRIVKNWIKLSGGYLINLGMVLLLIPWSICLAGLPWFLQFFASLDALKGMNGWTLVAHFAWRYLLIFALQQLSYYTFIRVILSQNIKMSTEVNFKMSFNTIHASVNKYFDRIPIGRLLNRFIKDVEIIDENYPFSLITLLDLT